MRSISFEVGRLFFRKQIAVASDDTGRRQKILLGPAVFGMC